MPVTISVYGTPKKAKIDKLNPLWAALINVTLAFYEAKDNEDDAVVCLFPYDKLMEYKQVIIIIVEGITLNAEREQELKIQLENKARGVFPKASPIICVVKN